MSQPQSDPERAQKLSEARRALLEKRLSGKLKRVNQPDSIPAAPATGPIPLSYAQERIWFMHQLDPLSPAYNMYNVVRLQGDLDRTILTNSFQALFERHHVLRSCFDAKDGRPLQQITPQIQFEIPLVEQPSSNEAITQTLIRAEIQRPFDLAQSPLLRALLLKIDENDHILVLTIHHIIFDEWSNELLWRELSAFYRAFSAEQTPSLPELPIQYTDFAVWQKQQADNKLSGQLDYWKKQLGGELPLLQLPTDRPRPVQQTFNGTLIGRDLPDALYAQIKTLNQALAATTFMTLLAAFQLLLTRYTGNPDILVGTPMANRSRPETKGLIGLFLNTLVMRADLEQNVPFTEFAKQVRQTALDSYSHQDLPFEKIVDELRPQRDASHNPIFQVMFVHQNSAVSEIDLPDIVATQIPIDMGVSKFDLTLFAEENERGLRVELEYSSDLFDAETADRLLIHYQTLLESIVENPTQPIADLQLVDSAERHTLLHEWNTTATQPIPDHCIHHLIEAQVTQKADAVAVTDSNGSLTYRELDQRANQLAHYLQKHGVGADVPVGLLLERSTGMVTAILGVLKAGGAYLPLDPTYPQDRLAFMLADTAAPIVIAQQKLADKLPQTDAHVIFIDTDWDEISQERVENPADAVEPTNNAYIIYTSGSTGKPKGVPVSHHNLVHSTLARSTFYEKQPGRFLLLSSFTFDSSIVGIFWTLCSGGTLVLPPQRIEQDMRHLAQIIAQNRVTHLLSLPSLHALLLELADTDQLASLQTVIVAGEACRSELVTSHYASLPHTQLTNEYGPTEGTVWSTAYHIPADFDGAIVPIGRPIPNMQNYIFDRHEQLAPIGVPGELVIGGAGITNGYLNRPKLSAEKFITRSFGDEPPQRLYRTGDLARYRRDGNIEFLGRIDNQVKIRGNRVELGEIENALHAISGVKEAVIDVQDERLIAYLVADDSTLVSTQLRSQLADQLPEYMVPSSFVMLESLPRTPNGKLDRNALPAPERDSVTEDFVAPSTSAEKALAEIWSDILNVERVSIHDNFFDLGGDSIQSIRILARANQAGLQLTPTQLFKHQTIAQLAAVVGHGPRIIAEQNVVIGDVPLTPIQRWFFEQNLPQRDWWNQSVLLRVEASLNPAILEIALGYLCQQHDMLRTRFVEDDDGWQQTIAEAVPALRLNRNILLPGSPDEQRTFIEHSLVEIQARLDLADGSLLNGAWFDGGNVSYLFLTVHHLVVDGISWDVLLQDLATAYTQLTDGKPVRLPAKTTSFKRWAEQLAETAPPDDELAYWLSVAQDALSLPVDAHNERNRAGDSRTVRVALSAEKTHALLHDVPSLYRTQINDALLTALVDTTTSWSGQNALLLALEGHGREPLFDHVDVSRTVGWFTTVHPVRLTRTEGDLGQRLRAVKAQLRAVPQRGMGYGLLRYGDAAEARDVLASAAQPQILFNYLGRFGSNEGIFQDVPLPIASFHGPENERAYLIEINALIEEGQLVVNWTYNPTIHAPATIEHLAQSYVAGLAELVAWCDSAETTLTPSDFDLLSLTQTDLDQITTHFAQTQSPVENIIDILPLTEMQQLMLFHTQTVSGDDVLFSQFGYTIESAFDPTAFEQAWNAIIKRHTILRSVFLWEGLHNPVQIVLAHVDSPLDLRDWRHMDAESQDKLYAEFLGEDRERGFDPTKAPLMRLTLFRVGDDRWRFVWSNHHLILDRWCIGIIMHELHHLYAAFRDRRTPKLSTPAPYRDYIAWLQQQDDAISAEFWRNMLDGITQPTTLEAEGDATGQGSESLRISAELVNNINQFAQQQRLTSSSVLQGSLALLLSRYTGQNTIVNGVTVSGRPPTLSGVAGMLGSFINNVPFRIDISHDATLTDWLQAIQQAQQAMQPFEHNSPLQIQNWSAISPNRPLFEVLFLYQAAIADSETAFDMRQIEGGLQTNYPLTLVGEFEPDGRLLLEAVYDRSRFNAPYVEQLLADWRTMLTTISADASLPIAGYLQAIAPPDHQRVTRHSKNAITSTTPYRAPDNAVERRLVTMWEQLLDVNPVSVDDDFFALGGSSLTAMHLFTRIADQFSVNLPLSVLFDATTVAQLAARIAQETGVSKTWSSLVPIQPEGDKPPFFCIHGLTGDVLWFRRLGQLMAPDQPFYGIQARGLDGVQEAFDDIGRMATAYILEIKTLQPDGPYYLGGASLGGTVALEMAQQLARSGDDVALLVMFDHAPDIGTVTESGTDSLLSGGSHFITNAPHWVGAMRELGREQVMQRIRRKARVGWKRLGDMRKSGAGDGVDSADLLDYGSELPEFRQRMIEAHWDAISNYIATPYDKPIVLLQARAQPLLSTEQPERIWRSLATGQLTIITVPGSHEGMFSEPHVKTLSQELQSQLNAAQK